MAAALRKGDGLNTEVNIFAVLTDAVAANHLHCSTLLSVFLACYFCRVQSVGSHTYACEKRTEVKGDTETGFCQQNKQSREF